jgi:hypothetical protein
LEETGTKDMAMQMMAHMLGSFKEMMPDVPDAMWTMALSEIDPDELIELCIPAYENNFTHEEIKQLLEITWKEADHVFECYRRRASGDLKAGADL